MFYLCHVGIAYSRGNTALPGPVRLDLSGGVILALPVPYRFRPMSQDAKSSAPAWDVKYSHWALRYSPEYRMSF